MREHLKRERVEFAERVVPRTGITQLFVRGSQRPDAQTGPRRDGRVDPQAMRNGCSARPSSSTSAVGSARRRNATPARARFVLATSGCWSTTAPRCRRSATRKARSAVFDAARALAGGNPDIEFNRGCALRALGRRGEALEGFDRALALRPDDPEALVNRVNVLLELRRADEALVSAERAVVGPRRTSPPRTMRRGARCARCAAPKPRCAISIARASWRPSTPISPSTVPRRCSSSGDLTTRWRDLRRARARPRPNRRPRRARRGPQGARPAGRGDHGVRCRRGHTRHPARRPADPRRGALAARHAAAADVPLVRGSGRGAPAAAPGHGARCGGRLLCGACDHR